ncbi:hypothetical protein HDV00_002511 [Rhizophlyctis rosea]|nr:hypothetical protein HDV00_002511 [Rhizophlyctis rosea]
MKPTAEFHFVMTWPPSNRRRNPRPIAQSHYHIGPFTPQGPSLFNTMLPPELQFKIFKILKPDDGFPHGVPSEATNHDCDYSHRCYGRHLAQVCRLWPALAFQLREGSCMDVRNYQNFPNRPYHDGYKIFLEDSLRVAHLRSLQLAGPNFVETLDITFSKVKPTQIYSIEFDCRRDDDLSAIMKKITEVFSPVFTSSSNAANTESPRLKIFKLSTASTPPYPIELTPLISLLDLLSKLLLKHLTLDVPIRDRTEKPLVPVPQTLCYPQLEYCKVSIDILFPHLGTAMPNLTKLTLLDLRAWKDNTSFELDLSHLTQRTSMAARGVPSFAPSHFKPIKTLRSSTSPLRMMPITPSTISSPSLFT